MVDFLILIVQEIWHLLKPTSIFRLVGFALAGVLGFFAPAAPARPLVVR
jgi:hypothetical protein